MSKMSEQFKLEQLTGSIGGDEDYLYEQYLMQEKMNEEYWQHMNTINNQPKYMPTPEEEQYNFEQIQKQNGVQ